MQSDSAITASTIVDARIKAHVHLVRFVARDLRSAPSANDIELEDLVAFGMKGLFEAAARFDSARGTPFVAFARRRIRGAMLDGIRQLRWFGRRAYRRLRADKATDGLDSASLQPTTSPRMIHLQHGDGTAGEDWLSDVVESGPVGTDARWNGRRLVQLPVEEDDTLATAAADNLRVLPARERRLLHFCYYEGKTLSEAARIMGFRRSWASRLHARALATLRAAIESGVPLSYRRVGRPETTDLDGPTWQKESR